MCDKYIHLTEAQADFLNRLGHASRNYREACEAVARRANEEHDRMQTGFTPFGPNHQSMQEMSQYYGAVKALLEMIWHAFPIGQMFTGQMMEDARDEVKEMIKESMAESKYGISGFKYWTAEKESV